MKGQSGKHLFDLLLGIAAFLWLRWLDSEPDTSVRRNDDETEDSQGEREHCEGGDCWCDPQLFFDGGEEFGDVWVHKQPGDELPPSYVLASAIADAISGNGEDRYFPPQEIV